MFGAVSQRKKPRKPLSPLQEIRLLKIIIGLVILSILYLLFAPNTGVYTLLKLRRQAIGMEQQTAQLIKENQQLKNEIERITKDLQHLDRVARERGMLKDNEEAFDFPEAKK